MIVYDSWNWKKNTLFSLSVIVGTALSLVILTLIFNWLHPTPCFPSCGNCAFYCDSILLATKNVTCGGG